MRRFAEVAKTGLTAVLLSPLRTAVTVCALLAILVPFLIGLGIAGGIEQDAAVSIQVGGDLYVTGRQFGRNTPLPRTLVEQIRKIEGISKVVPRIVGRVVLGQEQVEVVLVGIPAVAFPASVRCIDGRLPQTANTGEFVIGTELARRLKLKTGSLLPPFYRNPDGEYVSEIVGIFDADVSLWQAHLMFTTLETAERVFNQTGLATDLVVYCQSGYAELVSRTILRDTFASSSGDGARVSLQVTSRESLSNLLATAQRHREGVFNLHFVLVFVVGLLVIMMTSGLGLPERRREIGILKATGWQTDDILLRSLVESSVLSLSGASCSILAAYLWLKLFNGWWIAGIFIPGIAADPGFPVPFRLTPVPALLAYIMAFAITMTGSVWSTWRAAIVPPDEAMR